MRPGTYEARSLDTGETAVVHVYGGERPYRRQAIVDCITRSWGLHGYGPTVREVGAAIGLRSAGAVRYHLNAMRAAGIIESTPDVARSLRVVQR